MKIVYLAAGAGGMYCGSCLHDNTLAAALMGLGHDVALVPTYTPLRTDEENVSDSRLFFGGINVYLQQHSALFRHTPWFVDSLLNRPSIIEWVTKGGPSLEAEQLGDLTVSMLAGELGLQRKEVHKLSHWLAHERPDVVNLSNAMLMGMAREIRRLGIPIVCSLSGEDIFVEKLREPYYTQARTLLRERTSDVDSFVALNRYYADFMIEYLQVPPERVHVIPHGLNLAGHGTRRPRDDGAAFTVGYLAQICPDKGLHNLIAAAEILQDSQDASLPPLRIRAAGFLSNADRPYLDALQSRATAWGSRVSFEYVGELSREEKIAFLLGLDCMSLPTEYRESKGLPALEAMANAVCVVLPDHGAFSELIASSGGGVLHAPHQPEALADVLRSLMKDPDRVTYLGAKGQQAIAREHTADLMARRTLELYDQISREARRR